MKIRFYNIKTSEKFEKSIADIIKEFTKSEPQSGMPFRRSVLSFMADNYGSFAELTEEQWDKFYKEVQNVTD